MKELTQEQADTINDLASKSFEIHFDFLKMILSASLLVLGILVGLVGIWGDLHIYNPYIRIVYILALSTLPLGILCVGICLYGFVLARRSLAKEYVRSLIRKLKNGGEKSIAVRQNVSMFYTYAEYAGFVFLMMSVVCFALYLILMVCSN